MIISSILLGIIGTQEIIIIAIIILLLFGGRKIPELMQGLGRGMKEFRDASSGKANDEEKDEKSDSDKKSK